MSTYFLSEKIILKPICVPGRRAGKAVFLTSSILILGISVLRIMAGDRLSGQVRYALWLLASGKKGKRNIFQAATSLSGSWSTVKERIRRVTYKEKRFKGTVSVCAVVLGVFLLAGCSFTGRIKMAGDFP